MNTPTVIALALAAGILFAFGNQMSRLALRHTDSRTATLAQIAIGVALYWLAAPFYLESWYWVSAALPWLVLAGLIRPIISANLGMAGTRILGPTVSSTLSATAPVFGITFGVLILGETLSLQVTLGTIAIIAGVVSLSAGGAGARNWPLWAMALPMGAALVRSLTHGLAKVGLATVPDPFFVALVAYSVSLPLALAELAVRERSLRPKVRVGRGGIAPLVGMGLSYGVAVLALNTALLHGELVVVSPLVACSPVFTLLLGRWVFDEDRHGARVWLAVALVVPGVIAIGLDR